MSYLFHAYEKEKAHHSRVSKTLALHPHPLTHTNGNRKRERGRDYFLFTFTLREQLFFNHLHNFTHKKGHININSLIKTMCPLTTENNALPTPLNFKNITHTHCTHLSMKIKINNNSCFYHIFLNKTNILS